MNHQTSPQDWFDTSNRVKLYPSSCERISVVSTGGESAARRRDDDDIDIDDVLEEGPTQPDQRVPCKWGTLSAAKTYDDALAVLEDAINRFSDLCRVSFCESGLELSGRGGDRIVWPVGDILQRKTSEKLFDECVTLSTRLYELIDDYNRIAEIRGTEEAMTLLFERVQGPDGLAPAVWAVVGPESSVPRICDAIHKADKLADSIIRSSPEKAAEVERAKEQLSGVEFVTMEEAVAKLTGNYRLSKPGLVMVALATTGRIWNTDPETESILKAICSNGVEERDYFPLSKKVRNELFVRTEVGEGRREMLVDGTWLAPHAVVHSRQRLITLYKTASVAPTRSIGFRWKRNLELPMLTEEMARSLQALAEVDTPWGRDLHIGIRDCMLHGVSPMGHEVAKVVQTARDAWKMEYGMTDDAVEGVMGALNVVYSFTIEPDDATRFCAMHSSRCLRLIGLHTKIDSVPLYKWDTSESNSTARAKLAKQVLEMEKSITRSMDQIKVLPHKMGLVSAWRDFAEKEKLNQGSEWLSAV